MATAALLLLGGLPWSPDGSSGTARASPAIDAVLADPWWPEWLAAFDRDDDKLDDAAEAAAAREETVAVLVSFGHEPADADLDALEAVGAEVQFEFQRIPTIQVRVTASELEALSDVEGVVAVEWDRPLYASLDVSAPSTQATRRVGGGGFYDGFTAEDLGYTGDGILIAVADTGVNEFHEAFQPTTSKFVGGADSTAIAPPTCGVQADEAVHGTHVASTAVGNPPGKTFRGTAFGANLFEMKIGSAVSLGGIDRGFEFILDYNAAIDAGSTLCPLVVAKKIDVVTLSFGSHSRGGPNAGSTEPLVTALTSSGVVVTIAAGNCGPQGDSTLCSTLDDESIIDSPGNAAGAITAANSNDRNTISRLDDILSASSSRGPNSATTSSGDPTGAEGSTSAATLKDRHRKPDVSAPGTSIFAAAGANSYVGLSGTSMSTPHIAGIAALLLEAGEDAKAETGGVNKMRPTGPGYDAARNHVYGQHPVRDAILHGAEYSRVGVPAAMLAKWEGPGANGLTWNNGHGYGQVNAFIALCWAWDNVLEPAGATPPAAVVEKCPALPPPPPLELSAGGPYIGAVGETIQLAARAIGGERPFSFAWDLDADGAFDDATGDIVDHVATEVGTFTVAVQVTDAAGTVLTASAELVVFFRVPEVFIAGYDFDDDALACTDTQGWFDATGHGPSVPPVPGPPWHLTVLNAQSGCTWYHGVDAVQTYHDNSVRELWGPCMTLPPGVSGGRLEFQVAGVTEPAFDFLYAVVNRGCLTQTEPGVPLTEGARVPVTVAAFDGPRGNIAESEYATANAILDAGIVGGGPFQLGFRFVSDLLIFDKGYWIDDFKLYVRDRAPTITVSGTLAGDEGTPLSFVATASDADGDPVTMRAEGLPDGATFDAATGAFGWTPAHSGVGTNEVTIVASDGLLESRSVVTLEVFNLPPTAAGSPASLEANRVEPMQFTDASTDPNGGQVSGWLWEFGDGTTSTEQHPSHQYTTLGKKDVHLTVTDDDGASSERVFIAELKVKNKPPKAHVHGPGESNRADPTAFEDGSTDDDGTIVSWSWDFGDGATSTEQDPTHLFAELGTFLVTLTVTDDDGATASSTWTLLAADGTETIVGHFEKVVNLLPVPQFATDPERPMVLLPIRFQDHTVDRDGEVVAWAWTFGDGKASTERSPTHAYLQGGTYDVGLTTRDNDGGVATLTRQLVVCPDVQAALDPERVRLVWDACLSSDALLGALPR